MLRALLFCLPVMCLLCACEPEAGCTDPAAPNFTNEAGIDDGSCQFEVNISQAQLNEVLTPYRVDITGTALAGDITIPHILTNPFITDPDSTYRDILTTGAINLGGDIPQGTIIVKRIYLTNPDGTKGARSNTYVMIKQYPGYYPEGRDWEFAAIKYTSLNDYTRFPNGILGDATFRGKVALCGTCHGIEADGVFGN
jgi:hypothetical protein